MKFLIQHDVRGNKMKDTDKKKKTLTYYHLVKSISQNKISIHLSRVCLPRESKSDIHPFCALFLISTDS